MMCCEAQSPSWKPFSAQAALRLAKPGTIHPARARTAIVHGAHSPRQAIGTRTAGMVSATQIRRSATSADLGLGRGAPQAEACQRARPSSVGTPMACSRGDRLSTEPAGLLIIEGDCVGLPPHLL